MEKWEGKVSSTVRGTRADEIWPLFKDFFNLHKWFPTLSTSYGIHGINGVPGCIRYCLGNSINATNSVSWSKERLIAVDEVNMSLSYEIVDSNIGFNSYVSTIRIIPVIADTGNGCVIEWCFTVDPVQGLTFEDLLRKYQVGLHKMVKTMQHSLHTEGSN
ncbi:lachrymatory-factor synthase [Silene latifolia]|uniref:lachrymatory-factor synthase n=1 Tax=Silene latifolia TaxID=37657 RepID=UPI003D784E34